MHSERSSGTGNSRTGIDNKFHFNSYIGIQRAARTLPVSYKSKPKPPSVQHVPRRFAILTPYGSDHFVELQTYYDGMNEMCDPSVLTVFICGTQCNVSESVSSSYAVPYLASICVGNHFALDGIGGNKGNNTRYIHDELGFFKLDQHGKKLNNQLAFKEFEIDEIAGARGKGAESVIVNAMRYIEDRYKRSNYGAIKKINLIGFSRGAVCCTQLSWLIYGYANTCKFPMPEVNMFLFDPVAGGINFFKGHMQFRGTKYRTDRTLLPSNVKNCFGLVQSFMDNNQLNAYGACFNSNMPKPSVSGTNYEVLAMPGGHSASCLYDASNDGTPLGQIGLSLAQSFLMKHGTKFLGDVTLSDHAMVEAYAQIRYENDFKSKGTQEANKTMFQQGRFLRSSQRRKQVNRHRKISDHPFFVNIHHKRLLHRVDAVTAREIDWLAYSASKKISDAGWRKISTDPRLRQTATSLKTLGLSPA